MFGKMIDFLLISRQSRKIVSALLICSVLVVSFSGSLNAQKSVSNAKTASENLRKDNPPTDFELSDFQAETVSGAVKISWRTNFEQNILGFKVWRDNFGKRELVNEELIAGGFLKAGDSFAQTGDEYNFYDRENSDGLFYSLEMIDLNGESRWFGPIAVQPGSQEIIEENSKTISQLSNDPGLSGKQTDRLDFPAFTQQKETTAVAVNNPENVLSQTDLAKDAKALKFEVRQEGWYRVGSQIILQNGFTLQSAANWKLFTDGREQPMLVNADGSIEFYGRGIETLQTDAKIYWLVSNSGTGKRITTVSQKNTQTASTGWSNVIAETEFFEVPMR